VADLVSSLAGSGSADVENFAIMALIKMLSRGCLQRLMPWAINLQALPN
jgi:hypothetical protein